MNRPELKRAGDAYIFRWREPVPIEIEIDNIRRDRDEWKGYMTVRTTAPGISPHLSEGNQTLSSPTARKTLSKTLGERWGDVPWMDYLEMACVLTVRTEKEGEPPVRLGTLEDRVVSMRAGPLVLDGMTTVLFGEGGSGKSTLSQLILMACHAGYQLADLDVMPGPALILDYELDSQLTQRSIGLLARGMGLTETPDIHYRRCVLPLAEESNAIRRYIDKEGIQIVGIDSLGYAVGGDKNLQEPTMRMFSAIRSWGVTVIGIDHIGHPQPGRPRAHPFGSVYTVNSARAVWHVRSEQEDNVLHVGCFQTKTNFRKERPVGFRFTFDPDYTLCEREDVKGVKTFRDALPARVQIRQLLIESRQSLTIADIIDATGLKQKTVSNKLAEMRKAEEVIEITSQGTQSARRWALRSHQEEADAPPMP